MPQSPEHYLIRLYLERRLHRLEDYFPTLQGLPKKRRILRNELTSTGGREIRADLAVGFGEPLVAASIFEFQGSRDPQKPNAWLSYPIELAREHGIPVHNFVISLNDSTHKWAQNAFQKHQASVSQYEFYSPQKMVDQIVAANASLEPIEVALSDLVSAGLRVGHPAQETLLTRSWHNFRMCHSSPELDERTKEEYISMLTAYAPDSWLRAHPEARMYFETEIQKIKRVSRQEGYQEGYQEGRQEGRQEVLEAGRQEERRAVLLSVVDMRGLSLSVADRVRIERSRSLEELQRWLTQALQTQQKKLALD